MKKNLIALAIASAVAAPVVMADAPTLYGQINVAVDSVNGEAGFMDGTGTTDRDSRLGIKGSEDLGNGLKAVYHMEFGIKVGDALGTISGRNAAVGLSGGFGTVLLGRWDSPLKMSQPKDLFGDSTYADIGKDTMSGNLGLNGDGGESRFDNVVAYVSPSFAGIKLIAAGVASEKGGTTADSSVTDAYSVALTYGSAKKGLYLAAAMDQAGDEFAGANNEWQHIRFSAQYAAAGLVVNGIYQEFDADIANAREGSNIQVSAGYKIGKLMPKVKYSMVDFDDARDDGSAYGLGLDYALGKKTTGYIEYVGSDKEMTGSADDLTALSVGMVHKF
ncbi:MAG: porin [Thiotrichales bacterium]|nr:porin [Thiotrichales bacterium]